MTTAAEAAGQAGSSDKAGPLIQAIGMLSAWQDYTFVLYQRVVLPADGFVFWVKASEVTPNWLGSFNTIRLRSTRYDGNRAQVPALTPLQQLAFEFSVNASVHVSQDINQTEDETYTAQAIKFTTKDEVENFARVAPDQMYVTTLPNGARIAFSRQRNHYQLAGLWHYDGKAIYSTEATQLIDDVRQFHPTLQIVSNSLPFWLAQSTPSVQVLPSFLSGLNLAPPYVTAHIVKTEPLGQAPLYDATLGQSQLVMDTIRFTTYGLNNDAALDFQMGLLDTSLDGEYGISNMPIPVDQKKPQAEFQVIAQQKTMELQVNYYQNRARDLARRLITSAFCTFTPA